MVLKDEFLGKSITIIKSPMTHQIGLKGVVVGESLNTFVVLCDGKEKKVLKKDRTFLIGEESVEGNMIKKRPEDRIKIKEKKNG